MAFGDEYVRKEWRDPRLSGGPSIVLTNYAAV